MRDCRVGILANEYFVPGLGRLGGFGALLRGAIRALDGSRPGENVLLRPVTIGCEPFTGERDWMQFLHGSPAINIGQIGWKRRLLQLWALRPDVFLLIDYRPSYSKALLAVPRSKAILWIQDPRTPPDIRRIGTLKFPNGRSAMIEASTGGSQLFAKCYPRFRRIGGTLAFASPARFLVAKTREAYGVEAVNAGHLGYPQPVIEGKPQAKTGRPTIVYLGRLDPIKRPWIFVEIARRRPQYRFLMLGSQFIRVTGGWEPTGMPGNVELLGHVDGSQKEAILLQSWVLVNTSIHEALPVSFVESLAAKTPLVSSMNPDGIVSTYGRAVELAEGDGVASVEGYCTAIDEVVDAVASGNGLGEAGASWVAQHHSVHAFHEQFAKLCRGLGVF